MVSPRGYEPPPPDAQHGRDSAHGAAVPEQMAEGMLRFQFALRQHRPVATWALLGVMGALFVGEFVWGHGQWGRVVFSMGGALGEAIRAGQWWRLVSAGFLHFGPVHIAGNGLTLLSFGGLLELVLGRRRMLIAFVLAVIGGTALAAFNSQGLVAGASTGIWGLFTLTGALVMVPNDLLPDEVRAIMRPQIMRALLLNVGISLLPGISFLGHLGGAVVGVALGLLPAFRRGRSNVADSAAPASRDPLWAVVGAVLVVALIVGCIGVALATGRPWEMDAAS